MELSELCAYAKAKYRIEEQHRWADFPGCSVLCHPKTGKWVAFLMREWDTDSGTEIELCDLKCGRENLAALKKPYLSSPLRMHSSMWISVAFNPKTEQDVVFRLFDQAIRLGDPAGFTVVLGSSLVPRRSAYRDTPLPFQRNGERPPGEGLPEKLREMRLYYTYGRETREEKARSFYRQGKFMEDYEDDYPWHGDFLCVCPTYQDLTTLQLRGYFSWRTRVRHGEFRPIPPSAAYIYVYELLSGIGAVSVEDSLQKLEVFEAGYLDSGMGDRRMKQKLRQWMLDLAVVSGVAPELARTYADPELAETDQALAILRWPAEHSDEEVFDAFCRLSEKKLVQSPAFAGGGGSGRRLLSEAWRYASDCLKEQGTDLFAQCFGKRSSRPWFPLANAVCFRQAPEENYKYQLNPCRTYRFANREWTVNTYEKLRFDKARLRGFLHEADLALRRYLKTGKYLKENPADAWVSPFIGHVIEADRQASIEAARPKITIDLSGLEQIRRDADFTRDSLLTEEDRMEEPEKAPSPADPALPEEDVSGLPLDAVQLRILRALLSGSGAEGILREHHLMPSITADILNEVMFDVIGDIVVLCENDRLSVVEDYREELSQLLRGTQA